MASLYFLIWLNYACIFVAGVLVLLLSVSFSKTQRQRFPWLRRLDGRQFGMALAATIFMTAGYVAYAAKETALLRLQFQVAPGPGTSQVIQATSSGIEFELMEAAGRQAGIARDAFEAGQAHFASGKFADAASDYQRSIAALPTLSAQLNRGLSLRYQPDYPAAELALRAGLQRAVDERRERFEGHFNLYLSSVFAQRGKDQEAEPYLRRALAIYDRTGDVLGQAHAHLNLAGIANSKGFVDSAIVELRNAIDLYTAVKNPLGEANARFNLAGDVASKGDLRAAESEYRSSLVLYQQIGNQSGIARASIGLGTSYAIVGRLLEAESMFRVALEAAIRQGDNQQRANALKSLADALVENGKAADAIPFALSALDFSISSGAMAEEQLVRLVLGSAYRRAGKLDEAKEQITASLRMLRDTPASPNMLEPMAELGFIYLEQHRLDQAEAQFNKMLKAARDILAFQSLALTGLGMTEAARGNDEAAIKLLIRALDGFAQLGVKLLVVQEAEHLLETLRARTSK